MIFFLLQRFFFYEAKNFKIFVLGFFFLELMDDDGFESFLMMILMTEKLVFTFIIVFFSGDFFCCTDGLEIRKKIHFPLLKLLLLWCHLLSFFFRGGRFV